MIRLSDHFNYFKLLQYTAPSIGMMVFTSIYGVVDGFFVSNFVGKTPFTAVNLIYPVVMILGCIGFMFGTGGSALIAKTMGEGEEEKAARVFSLIVYVSAAGGAALAVLGLIFLRPAAVLLGAEGQLLENCVTYGRVLVMGLPAFVLQYEFQCLFATAEKPKLGLYVTVAAGVTNMVLDALFVGLFSWGLVGAASATVLSQCVGGVLPLIYFGRPNSSRLRLTGTSFDGDALKKTCTNGISELLSNVSSSLVGMLYNFQLLRYAGEDGVAAYGVLMYVNFIFVAIFIGYAVGVAPVVSYHYGAENRGELRGLLKRSFALIGVCSAVMFCVAELLARRLAEIFVGYDAALMDMTLRGFLICSFMFLFSGFTIFSSSFFTALNDGLTSGLISSLRTVVFQVAAVLILPLTWKLDGVWMSVVVAEALSVAASILFLIFKRKKFGYWGAE